MAANRGIGLPMWLLVGVLVGWAGLATSWFTAHALGLNDSPVVAVAEQTIRLVPGAVVEQSIQELGSDQKPLLVAGILTVLTVCFLLLGWLARRTLVGGAAGFVALGLVGAGAVVAQPATGAAEMVPVAVGMITWVGMLVVLAEELRPAGSSDDAPAGEPVVVVGRRFWLRAGVVAAGAAVLGAVAPRLGRARRQAEAARAGLQIPGLRSAPVPRGADLGIAEPWVTPAADFYQVDTAITPPYLDPDTWRLRIHGLVDNPIELTFDELLARRRTDSWITLNCVSNPVGGELIGNAHWSGVLTRDLLREAGVQDGADAVLQTSADGWTCGTPLATLTDERPALFAVAMNGEPLPVDHGFPVRVIVPGLYGYVSATKWVVDWKVTTMDEAVGYWIPRGWAAEGPVKLASRIDVPRSGEMIGAGTYTFAGVAWEQRVGIDRVEVSIDGGPWHQAQLGEVPNPDTWVQWTADIELEPGDHVATVRAVSADGEVQTSVRRDQLPDGATGRHAVSFFAH